MGKRHNTLSDDIFRNSKYIKTIEREFCIDDFKKFSKEESEEKENKDQYKIMLDIFQTLIEINNVFFSDSNKNTKEKKDEIILKLENVIYYKDQNKYSVRAIKKLVDSHTRYLYAKFNEWYETYSYATNLDSFKIEVEEEMTKLENIGFDEIEKGDLHYEKNKNSDYKIFVSKLSPLYIDNKTILEQYKTDFYNDYGIELNNEDMQGIALIYDLVAYANNGITNKLFNTEIQDFNLTERNSAEDYYKAYLTSLNIDIKDNEAFKKNSEHFLRVIISVSQSITDEQAKGMNDYIAYFDYYFFLVAMQELIEDDTELSVKTDLINKLFNDLKNVYNLMTKKTATEEEKEQNYKEALVITQAIIERNKKLYERLS